MIDFVCPECRSALSAEEDRYVCQSCSAKYLVRHGIACFNATEEYYGELARHHMRELLHLAETAGWEEAVRRYLPGRNPGLIRTINDPLRTAWLSLLDLGGCESALDFGCGLGGVSMHLAKRVRQVTALDGCFDRIRFLQIRRDQERADNIALVCNGAAAKLPFRDGSFDLIILNMVFPYLASTLPHCAVRVADRIILQEIARTLRPRGHLYLSVRNRHCFHWWKRKLLPFKKDQVARTFTAQGPGYYQRLLTTSGLEVLKAFWPLPNYKYPEHFVPLADHPAVDQHLDRIHQFSSLKITLTKTARRLGALSYFADTLLYLAQKEGR